MTGGRADETRGKETQMRKLMLTVAALATGALSLNGAIAQQTQTEQQAQQA